MPMPDELVLRALHDDLRAGLHGMIVGPDRLTVRHQRHHETPSSQYPCLAIKRVSADPSGTFGRQTNEVGLPEEIWELAVDLIVETSLPVEDDDTQGPDPTGYATPSAIIAAALDRLFPDLEQGGTENTLGGHAWQMRYDGTAESDIDASPDSIRVEERLVVFYRVRADRPTHLLMGN